MRRPGMTIVETAVALAILAAAMVALVQLVGLAGRQRRHSEARRVALQEVANQAERLAIMDWDEVAPEKLTSWQPSAELRAALPKAVCHIKVSEEEGPPAGRRIELQVTWTNAAGQEVGPAVLTMWKFHSEGQQ